jgi:hypothetical protein
MPTMSSVDSQFLENRKLNRQEIGAIFKVPESMMGFAGQKNALSAGTAIEQDRLNFIQSTIGGLCRRLEAAMEPVVKSFDPALNGWFDLDALPIMQAARRDRMATARQAFAMGVPFNEINQVYDLGFESLPWGDKGYLAGNLSEVGDKQSHRKSTAEAAPLQGNPFLRLEQLLESSVPVISESGQKSKSFPDWYSASVKAKSGKLSRFFFEQRGRALSSLEALCSGGVENLGNLDGVLNLQIENELLRFHLKPLLMEDIKRMQPALSVADEERWLGIGLEQLNDVNQTLNHELVLALEQGRAEGEALDQLASRVKSVYKNMSERIHDYAESLTLDGLDDGMVL